MRIKILTLGLACLLAIPLFASKNFNFFAPLFTEPIERVYFIMKDGTLFKDTDCYEKVIYMRIKDLEKGLNTPEKSYRIKDIAIVIHNHWTNKHFTPADISQYEDLKKHGFNGLFMLYCHLTNETYCYEEKEKSK